MSDLILYIVVLGIVAILVFSNYKKSQGKFKRRKHKRFRDSYLEKKKEKNETKDNEDLH